MIVYKKTIFVTIILIISLSSSNAQNPYISPGVRISFGERYSIGMEITFGVSGETSPYHFSFAIGKNGTISKNNGISYLAVQGGYSIAGVSIGKAYLLENGKKFSGTRFSWYGGLGAALVSYESIRIPDYPDQFNSYGIWGKLPILLKDEKLWWLM